MSNLKIWLIINFKLNIDKYLFLKFNNQKIIEIFEIYLISILCNFKKSNFIIV